MREYFARVARKAKGVSAAHTVVPNHAPVFPPQLAVWGANTSSPNANTVGVFAATGIRHSGGLSDSQSPNKQDAFVETSALAQRAIAKHSLSETFAPVQVIQPQPQSKFHQHVPERHGGTETILSQVAPSVFAPTSESVTKTEQTKLPTEIVKRSGSDSLEEQAAISLPEQAEVLHNGNPQELNSQPQNSKSSVAARQFADSKPEETSVHVRIGRIEIRMAPPVHVPASPQARKEMPRGFVEYESVRRYATRHQL